MFSSWTRLLSLLAIALLTGTMLVGGCQKEQAPAPAPQQPHTVQISTKELDSQSKLLLQKVAEDSRGPGEPLQAGVKKIKEKLKLYAFGVGPDTADGYDQAMDEALRGLAEQTAGWRFEVGTGRDTNKVSTSTHAFIPNFKVEEQNKIGGKLMLTLSAQTEVERLEGSQVISAEFTATCRIEEITETLRMKAIEAAVQAIRERNRDGTSQRGWIHLTGLRVFMGKEAGTVDLHASVSVVLDEGTARDSPAAVNPRP